MTNSPARAQLIALDNFERGKPLSEATVRGWRESADPLAWLCAAAALIRMDRASEARVEVARAVERATDGAPLLLAAAALYFDLGNFEESLGCLEQVARSPAAAAQALLTKISFAMQLGWRRDAITAGDRLIALDSTGAADVHLQLQRLLRSDGDYAQALDHLCTRVLAAPARLSESATRYWEEAELLCRLERPGGVPACVERALHLSGNTAVAHLQAARWLLESGAFANAEQHARVALRLDPNSVEAQVIIGKLRLWHGDADGTLAASARALACDVHCAAAQRLRGGALVLLRRYEEALTALDAAIAGDPTDTEAHTFRAEALMAMGRLDEAKAALDSNPGRSQSGYWIIDLLDALVVRRQRRSGFKALRRILLKQLPYSRLQPKLLTATHYELRWGLHDLLPHTYAPLSKCHSASQAIAVLEAALRALQGNRTIRPTAYRTGDGELAYIPVRSPRRACVQALDLIKTTAPSDVLRLIDNLIAEYPDSSLPVCYRGELRLWLGDYDEARADLEAAIAQRKTTRWAYYGLASLANVEGDPRRAMAACERSISVMGDDTPPIHAHRGEALRRLGQTADALRELRLACELNPRRLSAHLNRALAAGDAGDLAAEAAGYRWLADQAPGLASDAGFALGIPDWTEEPTLAREAIRALLEHMLLMMRGNRASSFATWISREGLVRVAAAHGNPTVMERLRADRPSRRRAMRSLLENAARQP